MTNQRSLWRLSGIAALAVGCVSLGAAQAPAFGFEYDPFCIPENNDTPYTNDFLTYYVQNQLWGAGMGIAGAVAYRAGCGNPTDFSATQRGRLGLTVGPTGSIQDDSQGRFVDNFLRLNWGMNASPFPFGDVGPAFGIEVGGSRGRSGEGWTFARLIREAADGTGRETALYGANLSGLSFIGASDRYFTTENFVNGVRVTVRVDVVGDAARVNWRIRNETANQLRLGLWYGHWVIFATHDTGPQFNLPYITVPGLRPIVVDRRFNRAASPGTFPNKVEFGLTQRDAFGLQVVNGPITNTVSGTTGNVADENVVPDQTPVDEFVIGDVDFVLDGTGENDDPNFGDFIFDTNGDGIGEANLIEPAFIQKWEPALVDAATAGDDNSGVRQITTYYRSTWGASLYNRPYSVVVDAPRALETNTEDPSTFVQNTFPLRVYVDNVQGFATVDQTIPLNDVRVTLELPDGVTAIGPAQKTISRVSPRTLGFVDFTIQVSPEVFGELNYGVRVESFPGPTTRVTGSIIVPATPRLTIRDGANLVGDPFEHDVPSWDTILAPLTLNVDFQAYTWNPESQSYIVQSGPERGRGTWIVSRTDAGLLVLQGGPRQPADFTDPVGPPLVRVRSGWNLIANPYNYAFPIGQIVGVSGANPNNSFTFESLIQQGFISGSLVYWDNVNRTYVTLPSSLNTRLQPNRGYWIFVQTNEPLDISFPPIFEPFVSGPGVTGFGLAASRATAAASSPAPATKVNPTWRLQLAARTGEAADVQNFVGLAPNASVANSLRVFEAPIAPVKGAVSLSIEEKAGAPRLASVYTTKAGRQDWTVKVLSREAGPVTITVPNLKELPSRASVKLVDVATKVTRDLRKNGAYTFKAEAGMREFRLVIDPAGGVSQPVLGSLSTSGNVSASKGGTLRVNYYLNDEATTTVRILSGGTEIIALSRNKADQAGSHSLTWNGRGGKPLKAGRYRVEISATDIEGKIQRREVSINVGR